MGENGALKSLWQVHSAQVVSFIVISIKFWNGAWIEIASHLVQNYVSQKAKYTGMLPSTVYVHSILKSAVIHQ